MEAGSVMSVINVGQRWRRVWGGFLLGILGSLVLWSHHALPMSQISSGWIQVAEAPGRLEHVQTVVPSARLLSWQGGVVIEAGSFSNPDQADVILQSLQLLGIPAQVVPGAAPLGLLSPTQAVSPLINPDINPANLDTPETSGQLLARRDPPTLPPGLSLDPPFHLPYPLAMLAELVQVGGVHRAERLHQEAAAAFGQMQTAAQQAGILLAPISGFRDMEAQTFLFRRQIQRRGSERAARFLSAPPGYSEHHTGYAIDIGDGSRPQTHVQYSFAQTPAYTWLTTNAGSYGFELSFPLDNPQGISFEPWHWRYVGSPAAANLFALAQQLS